jgi:hypothetical protein
MNYEPLIAGVLLPISTFINVQAITVPNWLSTPKVFNDDEPFIVWALANASLVAGIIATIALFIRMLEKKIKGCTRIFILFALLQGACSLLMVAIVIFSNHTRRKQELHDLHFTESLGYSSISGILSITAGILSLYQHYLHRNQIYVYLEKEISLSQRQVYLSLTNFIAHSTNYHDFELPFICGRIIFFH